MRSNTLRNTRRLGYFPNRRILFCNPVIVLHSSSSTVNQRIVATIGATTRTLARKTVHAGTEKLFPCYILQTGTCICGSKMNQYLVVGLQASTFQCDTTCGNHMQDVYTLHCQRRWMFQMYGPHPVLRLCAPSGCLYTVNHILCVHVKMATHTSDERNALVLLLGVFGCGRSLLLVQYCGEPRRLRCKTWCAVKHDARVLSKPVYPKPSEMPLKPHREYVVDIHVVTVPGSIATCSGYEYYATH